MTPARRPPVALFWAVFALSTTLYAIIMLYSLPKIRADAGGLMPFDLRPSGYSLDEARAFLMALSDTGRSVYLGTQHWLDTAYPPMLALMTGLGAFLLFRRPAARIVALIAVIGMAADLMENQSVAVLLRGDAAQPDPAVVQWASAATLTKTITTTIALTSLLVGVLMAFRRRSRARSQ